MRIGKPIPSPWADLNGWPFLHRLPPWHHQELPSNAYCFLFLLIKGMLRNFGYNFQAVNLIKNAICVYFGLILSYNNYANYKA